MFKTPTALAAIYPALVHHGIRHFGTPEVMRFLGRTVPAHGRVHRLYKGEVETELKHRPEGLRLKHYVNGNWIKIYDKHGQVLRVETTLTHPARLPRLSPPEDRPKGKKRWMLLRKSVADAPRRAEVCAAANDRYLPPSPPRRPTLPAGEAVAPLCRRVVKNGRRYRRSTPGARPTPRCCRWSPAANGRSTAFATATCVPRSVAPPPTSPSAAARPAASPACSHCYAPTVSSRKSPAPIAILSPPKAARSSPLYYPPAKPPSRTTKDRRLKSCSLCAILRHFNKDEPRPWLARLVLLGARDVTAMVVGSGALLGSLVRMET